MNWKKIKVMKKVKSSLLLFLSASCSLFAQDPATNSIEIARTHFQAKQVIPPSPEAAELGKYGNVPVSLFTGTPQVSIPLFELKGRVLSCPVSLSYNSTGLKPEDIAPWTGLSWALNAGGVITRSVMGDPDTDDNYFSKSPVHAVSSNELSKQKYFDSIRSKVIDTQADFYYYNFIGQTGKFLVSPDGQVYKKEKNFLDIVRSVNSAGKQNFIVYDEKGFRYEFDSLETTMIIPVDDLPGAPPMINRTFTSSWYLSKVISPYGNEEMIFEYYSPSIAQSTISGSIYNQSATFSRTNDDTYNWSWADPAGVINTIHPPAIGIKKKFIKKITLKKSGQVIGYINFESALNEREDLGDAAFDGERILKKIKLYSNQNEADTLIKIFELGYGYFGSGQSESPGYRRLKLKTVQEISPDTLTLPSKPSYIFDYYGESDAMPKRFTSGLDHWGFYNGQSNTYGGNPTLVPTITSTFLFSSENLGLGAVRDPAATSAILTTLSKITYPTGGQTSFEYEGNAYPNLIGIDVPVGGVRIKKMVDNAFTDQPAVTKIYEYLNEDSTSSGYTAVPVYDQNSVFSMDRHCPSVFDNITYSVTISANSIVALGSVQGSHVGYKRVTERKINPVTAESLGKTVYNYNIEGSSEIDDKIGNGDLLKQQTYDSTGNLLEEISNDYAYVYFDDSIRITSRRLIALSAQSSATQFFTNSDSSSVIYYDPARCFDAISGFGFKLDVPTQYDFIDDYISEQSKQLKEQTRKVFDVNSGTYLSSTKKFTYGNSRFNYPTLTEERNSLNEKIITAIKHVGDYTASCAPVTVGGHTLIPSIMGDMKGVNMWSVPVETLIYKTDSNGTNRRYLSGQFIEYTLGQPKKLFFLKIRPILSSVTASEDSCGASGPVFDANYNPEAVMSYDSVFNLIEETKINDITTAYLWDYENTHPVSKITNASYASVAYSSFESDGHGNLDYSNTGMLSDSGYVTGKSAFKLDSSHSIERTALDKAKRYVLTYWSKDNGGTVSVNNGSGGVLLTTKNSWKLYQKEIFGDSTVTISGTGVIDELRLYPQNAQMNTFTYLPFIGMLTQCDANNRIMYYEYDGFGRLVRIRDHDKNILKTYSYTFQKAP
jgi:YD repeat-containing protein